MDDASDYQFLASAVAGRKVSVHIASGKEPLASSDGQAIFLSQPAFRKGRNIWEDIVAQASLIGAGSLEPHLIRKLVGRREAARRYGYLEVLRAARLLESRLPSAFLALAQLKGSESPTLNASDSLAWALSNRPLPDSPAFFGSVRPLMTLRKSVSEDGFSALTAKQARGEFEQTKLEEFGDEDDTEESKILKLFQSPLGGNPLSDMLNKILGAGSSKGSREKNTEEGGGAEMPVGRIERALRRGVHAVLTRLPVDLPDIDRKAEGAALSYPEWDVYVGKYKPDWALVEEVDAWRPDGPRDLEAVLKPAPLELKRQLAQLGLDHEMHRRQHEGSELDVGRLVDCAIDLAAGHSPTALDVYRASRRTRRDLGVAIALDISGSTSEKNSSGQSVFDQQMQLGYQLARTLSELGDTVALFGFHSWGRSLVRSVRLKGPEERWSARVAERLAQIEPVGYTRTGAAIRHGTRMLNKTMRLPNRLLILITDGIAYDQDYETAYAEGDARKALSETRAAGTAVVCLCIGGSQEAEKLRAVFGNANLLLVDEPQQVTTRIRQICRQALATVSRRKLKRESVSF
ncbi:MAG: nitric oxide reductase activation protein NorD [Panacagrimonas sp.]